MDPECFLSIFLTFVFPEIAMLMSLLSFVKFNFVQVVSEYQKRGMEFIVEAINHPTYLEDITGLTELMKSAGTFELDWDNEDDDECVEI